MRIEPAAVFVYGTLRRGQRAHGLVAGAIRVEPAWIPGQLWLLPEGYPALLDGPGRVRGELCVFDPLEPSTLAALDAYEACLPGDPARSLYLRERREVHPASGDAALAWVYVAPPGRRAALVACGARPLSAGVWPPGERDAGPHPG